MSPTIIVHPRHGAATAEQLIALRVVHMMRPVSLVPPVWAAASSAPPRVPPFARTSRVH